MQVVYRRCAGLDVHKDTVVACVLVTAEDGTVAREVRYGGQVLVSALLDQGTARKGRAAVFPDG